jgi:hypothetical protein
MSTWSQQARSSATRAADSKYLEWLTRAGFVGYGLVHLLFAWLALQIAFGGSSAEGDQSGAFQAIAAQPFGKALLVAICVGLFAMAIWQLSEAILGHREARGGRQIAERVVSAGRAVVYVYLAWTSIKVLKGANASSGDSQQQTSQQLMDSTGGRFLVGFAGLVVLGIGIGLVVYGIKKKFEEHLHTERMDAKVRKLSRRLGVAGYSAKGVAYGIAGLLLVVAAWTIDPGKARGLDAALRALVEQPFGPYLLALVALGIFAYGAFCFVQAKYRKV